MYVQLYDQWLPISLRNDKRDFS